MMPFDNDLFIFYTGSTKPSAQSDIWDNTNPLDLISDKKCRQRYRFYPETALWIHSEVENLLAPVDQTGTPISTILQLVVFLRFVATNAYYSVIGELEQVSAQTVMRSVRKVGNAICTRFVHLLTLPRDQASLAEIKAGFYQIAGNQSDSLYHIYVHYITTMYHLLS